MQGGGGWGRPGPGGPPAPGHLGHPPPAGGYGQRPPQAPPAFGPGFGPIPASQAVPGYGPRTCPRCNGFRLSQPTFTWWGGLIGPKLLNHTVCNDCGFGFNAKTGKDNSTVIGIYLGLTCAIAIIVGILQGFAR